MGRWAAVMALISLVALAAFIPTMAQLRGTTGATWQGSLVMGSVMLMAAAGFAAGILAVLAITHDRDYSWVVILALAPVLSAIVVMFLEILQALGVVGS